MYYSVEWVLDLDFIGAAILHSAMMLVSDTFWRFVQRRLAELYLIKCYPYGNIHTDVKNDCKTVINYVVGKYEHNLIIINYGAILCLFNDSRAGKKNRIQSY